MSPINAGFNIIVAALFACLTACTSTSIKNAPDEINEDGLEQAMEQEFWATRDPLLNRIPRERLLEARNKMQLMSSPFANRTTALSWQERGPANIGGRTRAIIVDKRDASGNTVIAASVSGGIFRTTNFTAINVSWVPVNDQLLNLAVNAMVQDNSNPLIIYAGTGEGWFNSSAVKGAGIFKSNDGGITFNLLPSTATYEYVQDMVIDNSGNVYASLRNALTLNRGVVRSADGGASWTQVVGAPLPGYVTGRAADLEVASNGDLYATLGIFGRSVVVKSSFALNGASTGALNTWQEITPVHATITQRAEIAVAPSNPQRLYLLLQDSASQQVKTMYRSSNGGTTWDSLPAPAALNNGTVSQTWFNLIAAVDPSNPDVLVVGGLQLARSTDAGANWTTISSVDLHVDQHVLLYLTSAKLVVGNDGGVYYAETVNAPSPVFFNKNNGYNVTQFYACDYHPTNENYFLAGAQDNNTQKFTSAAINSTSPVSGGDGGFTHIDQTDGNIQVSAATNNQYFRSINGGASFSYLSTISNTRGQFINPTDYDDENNILYCSDDANSYYVVSGIATTAVGTVKTISQLSGREVTVVKVDPFVPTTIWLAGFLGGGSPLTPSVLKISSANATPVVEVNSSLPVPAGAMISCIEVDPADGNHVVATLSNYGVTSVYESKNNGSTWTSIEGNLPDIPVRWALFAPATAQLNGPTGGNGGLLLATELGVWSTSLINGSATVWISNSANLPNVRTDMIKYRPANNMVVLATFGRGLYTSILPSTATPVNTVVNTKGFITYLSAQQQQLLIKTGDLTGVKNMTINIFDMAGRLMVSKKIPYATTVLSTSLLSPGAYVVKVYGDKKEVFTQKFVKQ